MQATKKKQTTPTFAQASTLKQLINDFVQDTKKKPPVQGSLYQSFLHEQSLN